MDKLVALQVEEAPNHAILPYANRYDVRAISLNWPEGDDICEIIMEVSTHDDYAILKFSGIEGLYIPCGETRGSILLKIQDTSRCPSRTHNIPPVRVGGTDPEASLSFWAKSVKRINER